MNDLISRKKAIDGFYEMASDINHLCTVGDYISFLESLSAQPEYEPVKAEDFAKAMSENTIYSFMTWYGEALELMERYGFMICKKMI